jgi:hypothetical protein
VKLRIGELSRRVLLVACPPTARIAHALPGVCTEGNQLVPCPGLVPDLKQERARIDEAIQALRRAVPSYPVL